MKKVIPKTLFSRRPNTHKGDYGHVLVVAGSIGLTGAPVLCALSALRSGAGLVTLAVPESVYFIVASKLTEVMVYPLPESPGGTLSAASLRILQPLFLKADVLALGPGISRMSAASRAVQRIVLQTDLPIVLDADAITAFAGRSRARLRQAKGAIVITPHPGEMACLLDVSIEAVQRSRVQTAKKAASELRAVIVLKGYKTVIASPQGEVYVNQTGNPGMATAGMGDLLTGMIAGFIGQGCDPFPAAKAGVYLHGLAGDIAARRVGQISLVAGDVLNAIPDAFRHSR